MEDLALGRAAQAVSHRVREVVFGAGDSKHPALIQIAQMAEVYVTFIKQGNFTAFEIGTQLAASFVVVLGSGVHNDKSRQQALPIQTHVGFGRCFAPARQRVRQSMEIRLSTQLNDGCVGLVAGGGIEPPTQGFSVLCSTN